MIAAGDTLSEIVGAGGVGGVSAAGCCFPAGGIAGPAFFFPHPVPAKTKPMSKRAITVHGYRDFLMK
jgi:hypothetical protein